MAEFCKQCAQEMFPLDSRLAEGDFVGTTTPDEEAQGLYAVVLCEGCGRIQVDSNGCCITYDCLKAHGVNMPPAP